jgi:hypothetical protein
MAQRRRFTAKVKTRVMLDLLGTIPFGVRRKLSMKFFPIQPRRARGHVNER